MAVPLDVDVKQKPVLKSSGPKFKLQGNFLQYITHFKALAGLGACLIVLYMMSNDLPLAWEKYQTESHKVLEMEQSRKKVLTKLEQLQNTSKNIKPLEAGLYKLNGAESPEIATLRVAQQIVSLAQTSHNQYVSLTPQSPEKIDYSKVIDIAIQPDEPSAAGASNPQAASVTQAEPASGTTPVSTSEQPATPAETELDPETTVDAAKYVLVIKGNMRSLADFVYQMTSFKTLVFIQKIHIGTGALASASTPSDSGVQAITASADGTPVDPADAKKQINFELTFMVPWSK